MWRFDVAKVVFLAAAATAGLLPGCMTEADLESIEACGGLNQALVQGQFGQWSYVVRDSAKDSGTVIGSLMGTMEVEVLGAADNGYMQIRFHTCDTDLGMTCNASTWGDWRNWPVTTGYTSSASLVGDGDPCHADNVSGRIAIVDRDSIVDGVSVRAGTNIKLNSCSSDSGSCAACLPNGTNVALDLSTPGLLLGGKGELDDLHVCPVGWEKVGYARSPRNSGGYGGATITDGDRQEWVVPEGGAMRIVSIEKTAKGDVYRAEIPRQADGGIFSVLPNTCDHQSAAASQFEWIEGEVDGTPDPEGTTEARLPNIAPDLDRCVPWGLSRLRAHLAAGGTVQRIAVDCDVGFSPGSYAGGSEFDDVFALRNATVALRNLDGTELAANPDSTLDRCDNALECAICRSHRGTYPWAEDADRHPSYQRGCWADPFNVSCAPDLVCERFWGGAEGTCYPFHYDAANFYGDDGDAGGADFALDLLYEAIEDTGAYEDMAGIVPRPSIGEIASLLAGDNLEQVICNSTNRPTYALPSSGEHPVVVVAGASIKDGSKSGQSDVHRNFLELWRLY